MRDVDEFLATVLPQMHVADLALHNGDATGRTAMWSHDDPLTLFGAAVTTTGWDEISQVFTRLESQFSDCSRFDCEVLGAGVSDDLAYIAAIEHTTASIGGAPAQPYSLRVTTVFRREADEWKVVHRHGDPLDAESADVRQQLRRALD